MDRIPPIQFSRVVSVGSAARVLLVDGKHAWVDAVFERSLYLSDDADFLCLGGSDLGNGPLNAILASAPPNGWLSGISPGSPVHFRSGSISLGGHVFDFRDAAGWAPPRPPSAFDEASIADGLVRLPGMRASRNARKGLWPETGLARAVIARDFRDAIATAARAPLHSFATAVSAALSCDDMMLEQSANDAVPLIGLGPGLTPSGDDVIGGALIALHTLGEEEAARRLWQALSPFAHLRTSALSLAHLKAAAAGEGHHLLHTAIHDLLQGAEQRLTRSVPNLARLGHSSGFDGFAGAILAVEGWLARGAR